MNEHIPTTLILGTMVCVSLATAVMMWVSVRDRLLKIESLLTKILESKPEDEADWWKEEEE